MRSASLNAPIISISSAAIIGGPIVKNKLFFFFDYDGQRNTTPNTVAPGALPLASDTLGQQAIASLQQYFVSYANTLNNNVYLGKVDWNLTDKQHLSFPLQRESLRRTGLRKCRSNQRGRPHRKQQCNHATTSAESTPTP